MERRFSVDCNLGRLATWLRILGYDTRYDRGAADRGFLRRAGEESRIALTRNRGLAPRARPGSVLIVKADRVEAQLAEVLDALGETPDPSRRLTRCLNCNVLLEEIPKTTVEGLVPAHVYERCTRFQKCPLCARIFWPGTHPRRIEEFLTTRVPEWRPPS